ncbi:MAG: hypothetical protein GXX91_09715 [Verrucomicrobiaceae bacterium]|nr:hypothetical protein [Verrucomicrobiaceae bacterium]
MNPPARPLPRSVSFAPLAARILAAAIFPAMILPATGQEKAHLELDSPFASFVEEGTPYFTQTVDARDFGETPQPDNLSPRGIVIPAGHGYFACFDPDLLRWALFWKENEAGEYLSMGGMSTGSYRLPNRKAPPGQKGLPHPIGTPLLALPLRPGVSTGETPALEDARDHGHAEPGELGLGAIDPKKGRFSGLRLVGDTIQIEYTVGGTLVRERISSEKGKITRTLAVAPHRHKLHLRIGAGDADWLSLDPTDETTTYRIVLTETGESSLSDGGAFADLPAPARRWPAAVKTGAPVPPAKDAAWVFDDLPLPVPNPWKRNVRLADLAFFPDGRAVLVTFDGDIWIAKGLDSDDGAEWSRFAAGLHEPQNLALRDGGIFVFDRNGIVALHDTDGNGEADWYENVSNIFAQSAETRQYANDFIALPEGGFFVALGGQIGSTIGKLNGTVIRVAPDGNSYEVIATGFRQPYLGYDEKTKILSASDQQGNWKPATPIYRVETGRYFGFQPEKFKGDVTHPATISPAEVWIPHFINQSGAGQVWVRDIGDKGTQMGPLNDALIHIGYNRPEIFKVYLDEKGEQGAVLPLLSGFPSGLLNGRVNPSDGLLYVTGFQIFGSSGTRISGVYRVRPGETEAHLPREVRAEKRGILLRFDEPLSPEHVAELGRYSADRWNYLQTHAYGSGNYKLDGTPGQEALPVLSAKLSQDGKSLFLGFGDMKPSDSLRLTYRLPIPEATRVENLYLTVHSLPSFDLSKIGFADNQVDLTPRTDLTGGAGTVEPTAALGKEVAVRYGCVACHATGDPDIPGPPVAAAGEANLAVGPSWIGLWGAKRVFSDGSEIRNIDEVYLRESILDPARRVMQGYEMELTGVGMPSYLGVLQDHEIDSVVLYIKSLKKKSPKK